MSIDSAKAFYSKVNTDAAFRAELEQATSKEERRQIIQAAGYEFTQEDWSAATAQIQESKSPAGELSDEELAAVSGGALAGSVVQLYGIFPDDPLDFTLS